jgi:hypothetical protein
MLPTSTNENGRTIRNLWCGIVTLVLFASNGCRADRWTRNLSAKDEKAALLVVLESLACSETSPLPPKQYRPQFQPGVNPVIVVEPRYIQPNNLEVESATRASGEGVTGFEKVWAKSGESPVTAASLGCRVDVVVNSRWKPGYWDQFGRLFPGGIAWVGVSSVALRTDNNEAYVYSHSQWGPLQGESDLWILSLGQQNEWHVVHMYPLSRS